MTIILTAAPHGRDSRPPCTAASATSIWSYLSTFPSMILPPPRIWSNYSGASPTLQAIIPGTEIGQDQPLAALNSRQLLPAITDHLQKGNYRLRQLFFVKRICPYRWGFPGRRPHQDVPAAIIYVDETFRSATFPSMILPPPRININTPHTQDGKRPSL